MPSIQAEYLAELIEAHREAMKVLRELLAESTDSAERRRLAIAILRTRPIKEPKTAPHSPALIPVEAAVPAQDQPSRVPQTPRLCEESASSAPRTPPASHIPLPITDADFDAMLAEALAELAVTHPIDRARQAAHLACELGLPPE